VAHAIGDDGSQRGDQYTRIHYARADVMMPHKPPTPESNNACAREFESAGIVRIRRSA
jgi:hypothetical protein